MADAGADTVSPAPIPPPPPARPARLAVMLSGSGRTMMNLVEAIGRGKGEGALKGFASIELVIASRESAGAQRARDAGLHTLVVPGVVPAAQLGLMLEDRKIDLVVLAGYLKYVNVPESYAGRVVNIHPALLPRHGGPGMYGDNVHASVLAAGEAESGCTVHLVDGVYDHGTILHQRRCPVLPGDDPHSLAARVFAQECLAYPEALQRLIPTLV